MSPGKEWQGVLAGDQQKPALAGVGETQGRDSSGGLGERQPLAQEPDAALQPLPFDSKPKSVSLGFKTEARGAEAWDTGPDKRQSKEHPSFLPSPPALPAPSMPRALSYSPASFHPALLGPWAQPPLQTSSAPNSDGATSPQACEAAGGLLHVTARGQGAQNPRSAALCPQPLGNHNITTTPDPLGRLSSPNAAQKARPWAEQGLPDSSTQAAGGPHGCRKEPHPDSWQTHSRSETTSPQPPPL